MSLLLDALKRAEQEKHARQGEEAPRAESPAAGAARHAVPGRGAKLELESVEPVSATAAPATREREAARTVFAAKQPDALEPTPATGPSKLILAVAGTALLVVAAGGAYVWFEINRPMAPAARAPAVTAAPTPQPVLASALPPPATATTGQALGTPPAGVASTPASTRPAMKEVEATPAKPARPSPASSVVASVLQEAANAQNANVPVKLSPSAEPPRVPADIRRGYDALRSGDLATARTHYETALSSDPASIDGHLGLATAAARTGDRATAVRHYRRVLELDAGNASALAGLAALQDFTRPGGIESKLRADIVQNPQSPALHYTLGSLYASQARWTEAQAAFFEAYRLDPEDADIAYNLAVSLDHLGQARLAGDFYGRALAAARNRSAQFDRGEVTRRIAELKP